MQATALGLQCPDRRAIFQTATFDHNSFHLGRLHTRSSVVARAVASSAPTLQAHPPADGDQLSREGSHEASLLRLQASKQDPEQPSIASILPTADLSTTADVGIVGCGPAGLALAAELAGRGLIVVLVGHDVPFVNNYGVWLDEFRELELMHTLEMTWPDAVCYFREGRQVRVGREYGRVCRRRLREELLNRCAASGRISYQPGEVESIELPEAAHNNPWPTTGLVVKGNKIVRCRLATLASGGAAGRFLRYESSAPSVAAQTAYGIEAEVEGYDGAYDLNTMLFMDYRRHHSGLWPGAAARLRPGEHPTGGDGMWGSELEVPSFLYAMPLGGNRVFLEETCLVAKPPLPFAVLKRRLERRCAALGLRVSKIHEEEWSYIPTGGPLPIANQYITAFGAAANLVHPATGYSIARSLREAPAMAAAIVKALDEKESPETAAQYVWESLWTQEKRRQASFHVFGMELLCRLDLAATSDFFSTFFSLPQFYWRGFLGSKLSSIDLLGFAMATFLLAPVKIKTTLVGHLATHPAGRYLVAVYSGQNTAGQVGEGNEERS